MEFEQVFFVASVEEKSFESKEGKNIDFFQGVFIDKTGTPWTMSVSKEAYAILKDVIRTDFEVTVSVRKDRDDKTKLKVIKA